MGGKICLGVFVVLATIVMVVLRNNPRWNIAVWLIIVFCISFMIGIAIDNLIRLALVY